MDNNVIDRADQQLEKLSLAFKAIATPLRLKIILFLATGEKPSFKIITHTKSTQSNISQQLARMKTFGLLDNRKEKNIVYWKIKDKRIFKAIQEMAEVLGKSR